MQGSPFFPFRRNDRSLRFAAARLLRMTAANDTPERAAATWFIALREAPNDAELRASFEAWLAADDCHPVAWTEMNETARLMTATSPSRSRRSPAVPTMRRSRRRWTMCPSRRLWKPVATAALGACVALSFAPTISLWLSADHSSGTGQVETIRLEDGSVVDLGPDSAIAVDYHRDGRDIRLLSGQAMFEVRHNPERPFRVISNGVETRVLGTGFEVKLLDDVTNVAVRHGRVRVTAGTTRRELAAGNWARIAPDMDVTGGTQSAELVGAWRSGQVSIRNRPIADVIDEIRPWYSGKIVLADRALGAKPVTGTYDFRDPSRSLDLLVSTYGGHVIHVTPWLRIVTGS